MPESKAVCAAGHPLYGAVGSCGHAHCAPAPIVLETKEHGRVIADPRDTEPADAFADDWEPKLAECEHIRCEPYGRCVLG